MDLSDFEITTESLEQKVVYFVEAVEEVLYTEEDELPEGVEIGDVKIPYVEAYTAEANEMKITWKHNTLDVLERSLYLRENHVFWSDKVNNREREVLDEWMEELGYDKRYYRVHNKTIKEKGVIESEDQVNNWLQPNGTQVVEPIDVEQL